MTNSCEERKRIATNHLIDVLRSDEYSVADLQAACGALDNPREVIENYGLIIHLCEGDNVAKLRYLTDEIGVSVNNVGSYGRLIHAIENGASFEVIKLLVANGVDLYVKGLMPIDMDACQVACQNGREDVAEFLEEIMITTSHSMDDGWNINLVEYPVFFVNSGATRESFLGIDGDVTAEDYIAYPVSVNEEATVDLSKDLLSEQGEMDPKREFFISDKAHLAQELEKCLKILTDYIKTKIPRRMNMLPGGLAGINIAERLGNSHDVLMAKSHVRSILPSVLNPKGILDMLKGEEDVEKYLEVSNAVNSLRGLQILEKMKELGTEDKGQSAAGMGR